MSLIPLFDALVEYWKEKIVGKSLEDAIIAVKKEGWIIKVCMQNGVIFKPIIVQPCGQRVNISIKNNIVIAVISVG